MTADQATVGGFVVAAAVAGASGAVYLWPRIVRFFRALDRMFETINGRPAEIDQAGREQSPAVPSLSVQLADLKDAVSDQAAQNTRIAALETTVSEHGQRLATVESGQVERIVTKVESAQAWKAVEAIAAQPGDPEHLVRGDE